MRPLCLSFPAPSAVTRDRDTRREPCLMRHQTAVHPATWELRPAPSPGCPGRGPRRARSLPKALTASRGQREEKPGQKAGAQHPRGSPTAGGLLSQALGSPRPGS